jgi:hypothetical protein
MSGRPAATAGYMVRCVSTPPPANSGFPRWLIALIVASVTLVVGLPLASVAIAGFGVFRLFNPAAASDKPPEPTFEGFDVCSLITPRDAERAGARQSRFEPEVTVVGRVAYTTETGVPIDTCEYGTGPTDGAHVLVAVSPGAVIDETFLDLPVEKRLPLAGVGTQAYLVSDYELDEVTVVGRRGTTQFAIFAGLPASSSERAQMKEHQQVVVGLARTIAEAVPAKLTVPGRVATGPCAEVDANVLAAGLGGPVRHTRSHELKGATVCSYTSATGRTVTARLWKRAGDVALKLATYGEPVQAGTWSGREKQAVVSFVEGKALLEVDFYYSLDRSADPAAADLALAGAAADALLRS